MFCGAFFGFDIVFSLLPYQNITHQDLWSKLNPTGGTNIKTDCFNLI